jgi:hypothetical protein
MKLMLIACCGAWLRSCASPNPLCRNESSTQLLDQPWPRRDGAVAGADSCHRFRRGPGPTLRIDIRLPVRRLCVRERSRGFRHVLRGHRPRFLALVGRAGSGPFQLARGGTYP